MLRKAPLFHERPLALRIVTGGLVPLAFGAVTGVVLGVSAAGYWALSLIALVGGILAGVEHRDGWEGADRGLIGGALFGAALLGAHAIAGTDAKVSLPHFQPILAVFTAIIGMLAGALGGRLRRMATGAPARRLGEPASR
jgi:hypothetical protein